MSTYKEFLQLGGEKKWQDKWLKNKIDKAEDFSGKPKKYVLDMFPYPSGAGLHVGHPEGYTATDIYSRYWRMKGYNVLHPMGWDAFGLPAENYAIKTGTHPRVTTEANIVTFKRQIQSLGFSYDWDREIDTTDPKYYRWTQWIFLQLFKKGLAYEATVPINFCPSCKTGLANEEVSDGKCQRCGTVVERKDMRQWMLRITAYADRLLSGLDSLDWPESIKALQKNWIGRSEGAEVDFPIAGGGEKIKVYTTRPDTLFGATYMVLSPEHQLIQKLKDQITNFSDVENYIKDAKNKSDLERTELAKEKTGVELKGVKAINPVNNVEIPIWISDYVLVSYGTGAIMAVPAHDERDWEFAKKFNLEIIEVISGGDISKEAYTDIDDGEMVNSEFLNGLAPAEAIGKMTSWLEEKGFGKKAINYKLRDWVFSRQRYWGEPIPLVHCAVCKEKVLNNSATINFYEQETWGRLVSGKKTVETRALNPEEPDRYFGDIKIGNTIKAVNKLTGEEKYFEIINVWKYKNLKELYKDKKILAKIYAPKPIPESMEELEKGYSYTSDYLERVNKNGLIAWEVKMITPGIIPLAEKDLPLTLPEVEKYEPTGTGESPLATIDSWVNVKCPQCGGPAKRETNTMPQWAGSSWYWLRYIDPNNDKELANQKKLKYWLPVDLYLGGAEHAVLHLLYARFWNMVLYDIGAVPSEEPFAKLVNQGLILGEDGEKMSKSRGNVVNPDEILSVHGADSFRLYEMFMGPLEQMKPWSTQGMIGIDRFLEKIWDYFEQYIIFIKDYPDAGGDEIRLPFLHKAIKKVGEDIEKMSFNTAISAMMILLNNLREAARDETLKTGPANYNYFAKKDMEKFLIILAPFAPHLAEELWVKLGNKESIFRQPWPQYNESKIKDETIELPVQINGKVRAKLKLPADIGEDEAVAAAQADENVAKYLQGQTIKKTIFIKGKMLSFVV